MSVTGVIFCWLLNKPIYISKIQIFVNIQGYKYISRALGQKSLATEMIVIF